MDTQQLLERLAALETNAQPTRAPARLRSRIYSALVNRLSEAGPLLSLSASEAAGGQLCVFEKALAALPGEPGTPLRITGVVRSRDGDTLSGAELEVWHADADGCYSGYSVEILRNNLRGIVVTCAGGRFDISTIKPAPCEFSSVPIGNEVGHINVIVHARGYRSLGTRVVPPPGATQEMSCEFVLDPL